MIDYVKRPKATAVAAPAAECKRHAFIARCEAAHAALVKAGLASGAARTDGAEALPCSCTGGAR